MKTGRRLQNNHASFASIAAAACKIVFSPRRYELSVPEFLSSRHALLRRFSQDLVQNRVGFHDPFFLHRRVP
jgi:hypothetical protein